MNKKNYTFVSDPAKFRFVNSLYLAALTLFVAFVLTSCEFWQQPVRDYFEKWTSEVSVVKFEVDGVETYYDKDGNLCIGSEKDAPVTLFLINPYHYVLGSNDLSSVDKDALGYSADPPYVTATPSDIAQDVNDPTLLHLSYDEGTLKLNDRGGDIGRTVTVTHPYTGDPKTFTYNLKCNSKPPEIKHGVIMKTMGSTPTYVLCFNITSPSPDGLKTIHTDLKEIIINDGSSSRTINCNVESNGNISLGNPGNLSKTWNSSSLGNLDVVGEGMEFRPDPTNAFYYNSGIPVVQDKEQSFTIKLVDEAGLSSFKEISTASKLVQTPIVRDAVGGGIINSDTSSPVQLEFDPNYNALIKISIPTQATNGDPIPNVNVTYTLTKDGSNVPTSEYTSDGHKFLPIEDTGVYQLKVSAQASGYISSPEITYNIEVRPLVITYYKNDETNASGTQEGNKNANVTLKSLGQLGLSRTGYTLQGWSSTSNGSVAYTDGASVTLVSDITLYAIWQANKYNVTFDANGGKFSDNNTSKTMEETYDSYYVLPSANPTRKGYTFKGWYTVQSETGGNPVTSSTRCTTDSNHIVYARWEANKYTVTFDANGGKFSDNTLTKNKQETFDSEYTLPANPLRNGYTFEGWYTVSTTTGGSQVTSSTKCTTDSNHTVYARWKARKYNVTFDANGGYFSGSSTTSTIEETYDVNYVLPSSNPTKTGYTFAGWYTSSSGGNKVTTSDKFQITGTQTLYAHWNLNYWDISHSEYDSSNNTSGGGTVTIAGTKLDGKYGYDTVVTVNFIAESGKGLYEFTVKDSSNNAISLMSKTESGRTVTIKFKMPDSVVYINSRFKNAFTVKITPYTCTGDGDPDYVKESCANKTVRLWIANNGTVYDDSSLYYKDVSLDSNASFNGTICLPGTYTLSEFSNAKICAITTTIATDDTLCNCFGYKSVASNNANITLGIFLFGTSLSGKKTKIKPFQPTNGTWHELGDSFPTGIGFKYIWYNYTTGYRTSVSTTTEHTWTNDELTSGENVVYGIVTVAGIESEANTPKKITK